LTRIGGGNEYIISAEIQTLPANRQGESDGTSKLLKSKTRRTDRGSKAVTKYRSAGVGMFWNN